MNDELQAVFAAYKPALEEHDFLVTLEGRLDAMERRARRVRWAGGVVVAGILISLALTSQVQLSNAFRQADAFASQLNDTLVSTAGQWMLYGVTATAVLFGWRRIRAQLWL